MFLRNKRKMNKSPTSLSCSQQTLKAALCLTKGWQSQFLIMTLLVLLWQVYGTHVDTPCQQLTKSSVGASSRVCELGHCCWRKQAKSACRQCPDLQRFPLPRPRTPLPLWGGDGLSINCCLSVKLQVLGSFCSAVGIVPGLRTQQMCPFFHIHVLSKDRMSCHLLKLGLHLYMSVSDCLTSQDQKSMCSFPSVKENIASDFLVFSCIGSSWTRGLNLHSYSLKGRWNGRSTQGTGFTRKGHSWWHKPASTLLVT